MLELAWGVPVMGSALAVCSESSKWHIYAIIRLLNYFYWIIIWSLFLLSAMVIACSQAGW